jgi:hypothetical protein
MPALLPDGSQSALSVSAVLTFRTAETPPELPGGTSETGPAGPVAPAPAESHEAGEQ